MTEIERRTESLIDQLPSLTVGRYVLHRQIARGGMATIHLARLMGDEGFSRIVAAKRLLPEFAEDAEFVAMFLDEARIASKLHHRNVVPVLDVVTAMEEVLLVQEYVQGAPLHWLVNKSRQLHEHIPVPIAIAIAAQVASGLHAAHQMVDELGTPLGVVHRDVSPQNVMIAIDGTARLLDFGIAKATMAAHITRAGTYKGKLAYSAPEQLRGQAVPQSDIYSLSVMLWELLVGHRMHGGQDEAQLVATIMSGALPTITETLAPAREWSSIDEVRWAQLAAIEPIVKRGLALDVANRWQTAAELEEALTAVVQPAAPSAMAAWVRALGRDYLEKHEKVLQAEEASWRRSAPSISTVTRRPIASVRRFTSRAEETALPAPSTPQGVLPPPPLVQRLGMQAMIALLGALVVALAVGIILIARRPTAPAQAAVMPAPSQPTLAPEPVQPAASPKTVLRAPVPAPVQPAAALAPTISLGAAEARPAQPPPAPPPVRRPSPRAYQPPRAIVRKPDIKPAPAEVKPEVKPEVVEKPTVSCTPPYYYEGAKKIFKPSCL
jgi:eukaryotic-like serine/threonine-protein kinase